MHLKPNYWNIIRLSARAICDIAMITFIVVFLIKSSKIYFNKARPSGIELPYCEESPYGFHYYDFGATIFVRKNEVLLQLPDEIKELTLQAMGKRYGINFSKDELEKFKGMKTISVPIRNMKNYINNGGSGANYTTSGLKTDSVNTELADWIQVSRNVNATMNAFNLRFRIYADQSIPYSRIKLIFNTLGSNEVRHADLIVLSKFKEPEFYVE